MDAILYLRHDVASQRIQQFQQKAAPLSICSNYTIPGPNLEAGHTCFLDGINIKPGGYSNHVFTMEDCFDMGGKWTSYSCKEVQTLFTNSIKANASDVLLLDMTSASLKNICFGDTLGNSTVPLSKEEIWNGWWNAEQEWREGHSKNLVIIKSALKNAKSIISRVMSC